MIELLVMRHAKSDWSTGHVDFSRPLNARGRKAANEMAEWLEDHDLCPEHIVSSAAARTRATAVAVALACGISTESIEFDDDLYLASSFTWLRAIKLHTVTRLLICGHNPGLDDLVDDLAAGPVPLSASGKLMTTAAIAHFRFDCSWSDITPGSGTLIQLVRPDR